MDKQITYWSKKQGIGESYTFQIQENGQGWVGWIQEYPEVNAMKRTREELLSTLAIQFGKVLKVYEKQEKCGISNLKKT